MKSDENCIFCKIVAGKIPAIKIMETDDILCFMDIAPLNRGHLLVIPKDHHETMLEMDPSLYGNLYSAMCKIAKAVNASLQPDGLNVMQLNGRAANQVVPHVHVHLVPRWEGDGLTISAWEPLPGEMDQIKLLAQEIIGQL